MFIITLLMLDRKIDRQLFFVLVAASLCDCLHEGAAFPAYIIFMVKSRWS